MVDNECKLSDYAENDGAKHLAMDRLRFAKFVLRTSCKPQFNQTPELYGQRRINILVQPSVNYPEHLTREIALMNCKQNSKAGFLFWIITHVWLSLICFLISNQHAKAGTRLNLRRVPSPSVRSTKPPAWRDIPTLAGMAITCHKILQLVRLTIEFP